jgi:hypothetical protein
VSAWHFGRAARLIGDAPNGPVLGERTVWPGDRSFRWINVT